MAKPSSEDLALSILIVGEAAGLYAGFCPSWFTVSSDFFNEQGSREGNVRRIREGEIAATVLVLATGAAVSKVSGNMLALSVSAIAAAVFVFGYERAIARPASDEGKDKAAPQRSWSL